MLIQKTIDSLPNGAYGPAVCEYLSTKESSVEIDEIFTIYTVWKTFPGQQRIIMNPDHTLMKAALIRATLHVVKMENDFNSPNDLLYSLGYQLNKKYYKPEGNLIETTILTNIDEIERVIDKAIESTATKIHLLGENPFHKDQTNIGLCKIRSEKEIVYTFIAAHGEVGCGI